jgi:hypothetical protein
MDDFADIPPPDTPAPAVLTLDLAQHGPYLPPQQRIILYSPSDWEGFVHEWAHYCLKPLYWKVERFTGSGDRGIDIAGFADANKLQGVWDNYQCKHFPSALQPTDVWPEFGKILWYTFNKAYRVPRAYYFVAQRGAGTKLSAYLSDSESLKAAVKDVWDKHIRKEITATQEVILAGAFLDYVESFDFSIFDAKTSLQLIEAHRFCPAHAARFGGGLPVRPDAQNPPDEIAPSESRYVAQLLDAYSDHKKEPIESTADLKDWPKLKEHFGRQREAFYHAEGLRVFARDTVPAGTFESLQEEIYDGVIETHDEDHEDGFARLCEVTKIARLLQLTSNALLARAKVKDRDGICHQLANDDWLTWKK